MAKTVNEDALIVHKTEVVYFDKYVNRHYRLNVNNMVKVVFDYVIVKRWFGLRKELAERLVIYTNEPGVPEVIKICEVEEENFRRFRGGFRSFLEDNRIPLTVLDVDGNPQKTAD